MALRRLKRISDADKAALVGELKAFFGLQENIRFALLYGSMVDPAIPERYGDIDLAIYVKPEYVGTPEYVLEAQMEAQILSLLSSRGLNFVPAEVLVINNAPYSFLVKILKGKFEILKRDDEAFTDFIEEVGRRSMVNSHFRSESLRELVEG